MAEVAGAPSWFAPSVRPPRASHSSNRKATWRPGSALSSGRDTSDVQALVAPHHHEWQSGQAEIAAAGGADRRSDKNAAGPLNQFARSAPLGAAAPLPPRGLLPPRRPPQRRVPAAVRLSVTLPRRTPARLAGNRRRLGR